METVTNTSSVLDPAASSAETVTVVGQLYHRQRALGYVLASFVGSGLLTAALAWVLGPKEDVLWLPALLFFLLPFAISYWCRSAYIKPALLMFTPLGVFLQASDKQYQAAWADLAAYQVEFLLGNFIGDGYRLKLWDSQGNTEAFIFLEKKLLNDESDLRPDLALAYLCRYIGRHNRQAAYPITYRPTLLARKAGTILLTCLGLLLAVDLWLRWQHRNTKSIFTCLAAVTLALQVLGQKKQNDRYARYLQAWEAEGYDAASEAS
jgi:hypothetical protein